MKFISAKYLEKNNDKDVAVIGDDGNTYYLRTDSIVSPWPEYIAGGGKIDPAKSFFRPLSAKQLRIGILAGGKTPGQVLAVLQSMPAGEAKERALINWEYSAKYHRDHPLIATLGVALGFTSDQIDTLWIAAEKM